MKKRYQQMNATELAKATKEFDSEQSPRFLAPAPKDLKAHDALIRRIKRSRGRPLIGAGAERVQITVERNLLASADEFAQSLGITRSELIANSLRQTLQRKFA